MERRGILRIYTRAGMGAIASPQCLVLVAAVPRPLRGLRVLLDSLSAPAGPAHAAAGAPPPSLPPPSLPPPSAPSLPPPSAPSLPPPSLPSLPPPSPAGGKAASDDEEDAALALRFGFHV
jgi:hypothetical protein